MKSGCEVLQAAILKISRLKYKYGIDTRDATRDLELHVLIKFGTRLDDARELNLDP